MRTFKVFTIFKFSQINYGNTIRKYMKKRVTIKK